MVLMWDQQRGLGVHVCGVEVVDREPVGGRHHVELVTVSSVYTLIHQTKVIEIDHDSANNIPNYVYMPS